MKNVLLIAALFLAGCTGPGPEFVPYLGQQPHWPTSPDGIPENIAGVPIYSQGQFPPRPYDVIGDVITDGDRRIAKLAKRHHADAGIITESAHETEARTYSWDNAWVAFRPHHRLVMHARLIKYRTP